MLSKIDWLSASAFRTVGEGDSSFIQFFQAYHAFLDLAPELEFVWGASDDWTLGKGRKPYMHMWTSPVAGFLIFTSPNANHVLLEIQGRGCDILAESKYGADVLQGLMPRLTRIDVAVDMLTDATPSEFAADSAQGRFKSHSEFISSSGATYYRGSRDSERYCRVYRYNPPHPRAHLLRSEFVMKQEQAKLTAASILENGVHPVAISLGATFGWEHDAWQPDETEAAIIEVWRPERRKGKTEFWLCKTVAPLLVRMANEDGFDPKAWFDEYVLTHLQ